MRRPNSTQRKKLKDVRQINKNKRTPRIIYKREDISKCFNCNTRGFFHTICSQCGSRNIKTPKETKNIAKERLNKIFVFVQSKSSLVLFDFGGM